MIFWCTKGEIYPIENYDIPIGTKTETETKTIKDFHYLKKNVNWNKIKNKILFQPVAKVKVLIFI